MELGYGHPDQMLASLTSRQLQEWAAYYRVSPLSRLKAGLEPEPGMKGTQSLAEQKAVFTQAKRSFDSARRRREKRKAQ